MNWPRWTSYIENELNAKEDEFKTYDAYKHWTAFDELLQLATAENSETKQTTIHDKPYWNKALTDASDELKDAKWCYMKRNTTPNRSRLAVARENFEAIRKEECQRFILEKTENLNAAQARDFWKQFNRIFKKKTSKKVAPLRGGVQGNIFGRISFELWALQVPLMIGETFGEVPGPRRRTVSEPRPAQNLGVK